MFKLPLPTKSKQQVETEKKLQEHEDRENDKLMAALLRLKHDNIGIILKDFRNEH